MVHRVWFRFLRVVPVGFLALAMACASQTPRPVAPAAARPAPAPQRYDVIIIGAGMAGLTAGRNLQYAGRSFVILEATDRIGGRGRTDATTFSAPIDLGGAWIHNVKTNPLTPIITGSGYATQETDVDASHHLFFSHHFASPREQERFQRIAEAFEASLEKSQGHDDAAANHLPVKEPEGEPALPGEPPFEKLRELVALNSGPLESAVELEESSTLDAKEFLAGEDVLIQRGFGTFVEEYGQELLPQVRLSSPVTRIAREAGGVTVETKQGERFSGRMALVTVSTGVLAAGKIRFEPALPAGKMAAIRGLPMGLLDKVILEFSTPDVFPKQGGAPVEDSWLLYGGDLDRRDDDMAFVFRPMGSLIAIGFFGGQRAWELEKLPNHGRERMIELALAAMSDLCGCDAGRALVKSRTTEWGADEWTLGAYSAALPGQAAMRQRLAEPIDHQLYFASEACDFSTYNGSFAGAYNSALKSSYQMITCLRHQDRHEACP
ncbi:MAG TPA: FAD-dependent oxidoreductase [Thermoanaerobaculia bacterium]|jgi:monoamine oxidase